MLDISEIKENEIAILYDLILEMASFEHLESELKLTKENLTKYILETKLVKVDLLRIDNKIIGYLMYYYTYSSFTGHPSLYLEDIYIKESYRHNGYGKLCFNYLAEVAVKNDCKRMDFVCLDWNKNAQNFYQKLGANTHHEWLLERIEEKELIKLAGENNECFRSN